MTIGSFPHNLSSVYWIFTNLDHMIPLRKGKNPIYFGVKCQGHHYYKYNFWQQGRFHMIILVLYIGSWPNLDTWFACGRGRTLFILGSLPLYCLINYIDGRILWCTHFLFNIQVKFVVCLKMKKKQKSYHNHTNAPFFTIFLYYTTIVVNLNPAQARWAWYNIMW